MRRPPFSVLGAAGAVAGCAAMATALPVPIANTLASLGLGGASVGGRSLGGAARPLFVVSALLLIVGALGCSALVAALATSGALLLYLSMFELPGGHAGAMDMTAMTRTSARADAPTFYAGLAVLFLSFGLQLVRRRRRACRPILGIRRAG